MFCPKCNSEKTSVTDSRSDGGAIRRRRECGDCGVRFTTYERVELALPVVIKKDGSRENFDRDKIRSGLRRACEKRPVSIEAIDAAVEAIEKRAAVALSHTEVDDAIDRRPLLHWLYALLAVVVVFCGYAILSPKKIGPSIWRALLPSSGCASSGRG